MIAFEALAVGSRRVTFEVRDGSAFRSDEPHRILLDGRVVLETQRNVFTIEDLPPDGELCFVVEKRGESRTVRVQTRPAVRTVDVRETGARGDGRTDDTNALQAAIDACAGGGTVEIPAGVWLTAPLFLRDGVCLRVQERALLLGHPEIERWPALPAMREQPDGTRTPLGTWEGVAAECHAGLITAVGVSDVSVCGPGAIDGNASFETWWSRPKGRFGGWRPRLLYFVDCSEVTVQGVHLRNSPSWTVHPLRCRRVRLVDFTCEAPADSPNTDGVAAESCEDVLIAGASLSVGDDCIALKSGRRIEGEAPWPPTRGVRVSNCRMRRGHGALVIGSEMSGGVYDVEARDCRFEATDRGLRIKTRRGRGAAIDGVTLDNVTMRDVGTPFVVNCFYRCEPERDGSQERTRFVDDRGARPLDDGTPAVRNIRLTNVDCREARHSAGCVLGLPERPVENIQLERYCVSFAADATPGYPDMAASLDPVARQGLVFCNVRGLELDALALAGVEGPELVRENVQ